MKRIFKSSLILATFAVLAACGGGGSDSDDISVTCTTYEYSNTVSGTCTTRDGGDRRETSSSGGRETPAPAPAQVGTGTPPPPTDAYPGVQINNPAPTQPSSVKVTGPIDPFFAYLVDAPADGTTICAQSPILVQGNGLQNVELVSATDPSVSYARFAITGNGYQANYTVDAASVPNGPLAVRIVAWNVPAGQNGSQIEVMAPRTWNFANGAWPCNSPGSATAGN